MDNPKPTGVWDAAIQHLNDAEYLMSMIEVDNLGDMTNLAEPYRRALAQMRAHLTLDYQRRWWEIATQPVRVVVTPVYDEDGNVSVEVRPYEGETRPAPH